MIGSINRLLRRVHEHRDLVPAYVRSAIGAVREQNLFNDLHTYCMFIGYPRSGHSLIGSLLDAHANMVVAHELDALRYLHIGFSRAQLWWMILAQSRRFTRAGRQWTDYEYGVSGQWQGRFDKLFVIGDKKGWMSSSRLARYPWLFERLQRTMGLPIKIIHHVRNPYDNITTIARRSDTTLAKAIESYFQMCQWVSEILQRLPEETVIATKHEAFVADPRSGLSQILKFLQLPAPPDYLDACAGIVFASPKQPRRRGPWTDQLIEDVAVRMNTYPFLHGYAFDQ